MIYTFPIPWILVFLLNPSLKKNLTPERPNIILIYVDDMGIGDVSCYGGVTAHTPNIDRLAAEGKKFTQYYTTSPVCSPSRTSIMTGMYHIRWNINTYLSSTGFNDKCDQSDYLLSSAPTLAKSLKKVGYQTAHFGKWHMGGGRNVKDAPSINAYGFDEYVSTYESPDPDPLLTSTRWIWAPTDSIKRWDRTRYFVDKTLTFLEKNKDQACYINLWPDDIHSPWVPDEESQMDWKKHTFKLPKLQAVLKDFDREIGRLLDGIKALGIEENTLIIFTSDNGPAPSFDQLRANGLRGVKCSLYEGGILMPMLVKWPSKIAAGTTNSSLIASIDLFPTICKITGATIPKTNDLDGENFAKALIQQAQYKRKKELFFEFGRNEHFNFPKTKNDISPQLMVRKDHWKLFASSDGSVVELYDLKADPNEQNNVAKENPKLVKKLKAKLLQWYVHNDKQAIQD
ncbi:MAG: sulfatase-like hydrolase/transferase [Bacteroidota bacterium]